MRVIVFPQSGYINRIQAIASSILLAEDLESTARVCWLSDPVTAASADSIFEPSFFVEHFLTEAEARDEFGAVDSSIPIHLSTDSSAGSISLAGSHLGEQHFMPELRAELERGSLSTLIIRAGGKFTLVGDSVLTHNQAAAFRNRRMGFYSHPFLHPNIEIPARAAVNEHAPFLGLHLRYSDRSHQSPSRVQIREALADLKTRTGLTSLFIASDTASERARWLEITRGMGFTPWTVDPGSLVRGDASAATGALVDWRILGGSQAMVYFAESSFAEEAAVATGNFDMCIGLRASSGRALKVKAGEYLRAFGSYPRRHGWLGK